MRTTEHETIREYLSISDCLATAGQPAREQFAWIAMAGFDKVINLATRDSPGAVADERQVVSRLGMAYRHIAVEWTQPTERKLRDFFLEMRASADLRLFVHCAFNQRVSVFVYLYRVMELGEPRSTAWQQVLEIWQPDETWQSFIERSLANHAAE
ncbi:MAG: phosphatase [Anaerolineae bacterium]|nr:phosphatase [Anaerolineae bacterium]